jgi:hypothetical protein
MVPPVQVAPARAVAVLAVSCPGSQLTGRRSACVKPAAQRAVAHVVRVVDEEPVTSDARCSRSGMVEDRLS